MSGMSDREYDQQKRLEADDRANEPADRIEREAEREHAKQAAGIERERLIAEAKQAAAQREEQRDALGAALIEVANELEEVVFAAESAVKLAEKLGGEIERVVAGQLRGYLISTVQAFINDEHQAGSVESLLDYLAEADDEEDDD